jgi:endonuclease III
VSQSRLARLVGALRAFHGEPSGPPVHDPYRLLLWEQVGYMADDERRLEAFRALETRVGIEPAKILDAPVATLRAIVRIGGGIAVNQRADRLRAIADRVRGVWKGSLDAVLKLPLDAARRELKRYPSIGAPGAERILLLTQAHPVLGLDSNALRVLVRLGYGREDPQWAKAYRAAQSAASAELPEKVAVRRSAMLLLQEHGRTICRRNAPRCGDCPLAGDCPSAQV